jgi:hypothetical protein
LERVIQAYTCIIPATVYHEAVVREKQQLHPDAELLERAVRTAISVQSAPDAETSEPGLGIGEGAVLALHSSLEAEAIVSDDRRFLALLSRRGIPFLVPAALAVVMARQSNLSFDEAEGALERLRPWIREAVYHQATRDLREGRQQAP